jgi:hypothetical protein
MSDFACLIYLTGIYPVCRTATTNQCPAAILLLTLRFTVTVNHDAEQSHRAFTVRQLYMLFLHSTMHC